MSEMIPNEVPETKVCPYCAETIKFAAMVCKHCGRELDGAAPVQAVATPQDAPKKRPWIGFVGMVLLVIGFISIAGSSPWLSMFLIIAGGVVLAVALFTGNLSLLGR